MPKKTVEVDYLALYHLLNAIDDMGTTYVEDEDGCLCRFHPPSTEQLRKELNDGRKSLVRNHT